MIDERVSEGRGSLRPLPAGERADHTFGNPAEVYYIGFLPLALCYSSPRRRGDRRGAAGISAGSDRPESVVREWRNWQTRWT